MIERTKVSHQVLAEIKKLIKNGEFAVNEKLPSETVLAKRFGVSRSPVREALSVLVASGIVESKQGGGSWVRPVPIEDLLEKTSIKMISIDQMIYLIETRIILESEGAALAAQRRTEDDLKQIGIAQIELKAILDDPEEIGDKADFLFHRSIVTAAQNPVILQTIDNISDLYNKAMKVSLEINKQIRGKKYQIFKEHQAIYDAIIQKDSQKAREVMKEHLVNSRNKLESFL